jgi:hypothetical protein
MSRAPRRRGTSRGQRERESVQRQIAGSTETPTDPAAAPFAVESPDSTSAPASGGARQRVSGAGHPTRRRQRRNQWWRSSTFWTAFGGIAVVLGLVFTGMWAVASLQRDIAVNTEGLKGLNDKHNTFVDRVRDDFKRVEEQIKELFGARRREGEPKRR